MQQSIDMKIKASNRDRYFVQLRKNIIRVIFLAAILLCAYFVDTQQITSLMIAVGVPEKIIATLGSMDAKTNYRLGSAHLGGGGSYDLALSEIYFKRTIVLDKYYPHAHYQLARVYFLTKRYFLAIEEVNEEMRLAPDFSRAYYLRGLIYGYDRQFAASENDFREFIRRQPDEWAGYNDLAWIYFRQGKYKEVKELMEKVLVIQENPWILNSYGIALLNLGEYDQAVKVLSEAKLRVDRMDYQTWGQAYIGNDPNDYPAGLAAMKKSIDDNLRLASTTLLQAGRK